jgi:predicted amidohydrolase
MNPLKIAVVQFEHKSADKEANLRLIDDMCEQAAAEGADIVSFHECCISGYTVANSLTKKELNDLAEPVPDGPSVQELIRISGKYKTIILAGLFEKDEEGLLFNTCVCASAGVDCPPPETGY